MKSNVLTFFIPLFVCFFTACSSDDDHTIPLEPQNEFTFDGVTYDLVSAVVLDENVTNANPAKISLSLFNKTSSEMTGNTDIDGVAFVYFEIIDSTLQYNTYTDLETYSISVDGSVVDSEFNSGEHLLSSADGQADIRAQSGSVSVINFTPFNLKFTFTFVRNDGKEITGTYDGTYLNANGLQ